jgi:type III restriction enzyme
MAFLYDTLVLEFGKREIARTEIPNIVADNLNPKFELRPYQKEAFQRFILYFTEPFEGKQYKPYHLLFNMATGSGKTLIMAGLILYLYEKGYRNFLFFVNSNNIIQKTKDNFLNDQATKYLFNNKIIFNGQQIFIKEVENFEESDANNINIKFTTIQQLHLDLSETKENSVTFEDLKEKRIVLIADEAHHLNTGTSRQRNLFGTWEGTVLKILNQNIDNVLLEFTATLDLANSDIKTKYHNKIIFKYDLAQFRIDGYSKEIHLLRSLYDETDRILQALILNIYRQEIAVENNINLKPVILFKAKRTIAESEQNKTNFHKLVENLSGEQLLKIKETSTVDIVQKAFTYFQSRGITEQKLVEKIKFAFKEENCISANNDAEAEKNQILLNTLEDENNPIRAVFAVQKLNEGWDVLNLFDIVRLYEGRDGKTGNPGKTTISEAQLIGRGARYYPFITPENKDKYRRKFDKDPSSPLKILEELYYHTKEDSRYIAEIKKALIDSGIYEDEDNLITKELVLKEKFKKTKFYRTGKVFYNKQTPKTYNNVKSFADLGVSKKNYTYQLPSGLGKVINAFNDIEEQNKAEVIKQKFTKLKQIPEHIIRYALSQNPFFYFSNLHKYFPNIKSITDFIRKDEYLGGLEITFKGTEKRLKEISNSDLLYALQGLLTEIEADIKNNLTTYTGSNYIWDYIHNKFKDKKIRVNKNDERANGQEELVANEDWYVFNANYGTSEEKDFVEMFAAKFESINQKFDDIYLIRNEREIKIYDKQGRAFEPDFILFAKQKNKEAITYQVFIEPKGGHLLVHDKWKEDFLKEMRKNKKTFIIDSEKYLVTGVPFYNNKNENQFKKSLEEVLSL